MDEVDGVDFDFHAEAWGSRGRIIELAAKGAGDAEKGEAGGQGERNSNREGPKERGEEDLPN